MGADLILENRSGIQNPVNLVTCSTYQNSAKGANPLGLFSTTDGQRISGVYTPSGVSLPKKRLLARKVAYTTLSYLGISNKRTSKGNSSLQTSSGIGVYRLAWTTGSFPQLVGGPVDPWERRLELLTLAVEEWQIGNSLVLYPNLLDENLKALLSERFNGSNALLKLCDEALRASVLAAPQ